MKKRFICVFLVFLSVQTFSVAAQANKRVQIKQIDTYCRSVDVYIKRNEKSAEIFADISSTQKAEWQKFKNEAAREEADNGGNLNDNALVWRRSGKIIGANFTFQSPSRDWAHFVMHYFRPDGSLAKIEAKLNSFYGNMTVERTLYYDRNGSLLRRSVKFFDLTTQKAKEPEEIPVEKEFSIFKKVAKLPFISLSRK